MAKGKKAKQLLLKRYDSPDDKVNVEGGNQSETTKKEDNEDMTIEKPDNLSKTENFTADPPQETQHKDSKKKKVKKDQHENNKATKRPGKKTIAAMQETLKKIKEEEERVKKEAKEAVCKAAEEVRLHKEKEEAGRLKKEHKKQREREKKEKLKAEGKYLTPKQLAQQASQRATLKILRAQGLDVPAVGEKRASKSGTRFRPTKHKEQQKSTDERSAFADGLVAQKVLEENHPEETMREEVKDSWDVETTDDDQDTDDDHPKSIESNVASSARTAVVKQDSDSQEDDSSQIKFNDDDGGLTDDDLSVGKRDVATGEEKAIDRIRKRKEAVEKKKDPNNLRAPVVCVLGHVDTGKTKILDKLRRTNVQDGEAGGITQQIGATNVPMKEIREQANMVQGFQDLDLKLPGLLIIDTPGHESFSNLRSRGSSLCDIAILVIDIMHGLEPQTIESINLLKSKNAPFVVALNKIDRLYDWSSNPKKDVRELMKLQEKSTQADFDKRFKHVVAQMAEQSLNAALFYENPNPKKYVSMVPTSAVTGDGMGNLMALIVELTQTVLSKELVFSEEVQATVLEVKAISGLGTTIDVILVNGTLHEGDTIVLAGTEGPIVTQIRSLLMPQPMKELRVKNRYTELKEVKAAQGVKIAAKDLEKAIAGLNLLVARHADENDLCKQEVAKALKSFLSRIKLADKGVYVQASTLGSLEALNEFLQTSSIPVANIRIGPVVKRDVMKASIMLEHTPQFAVILAFDVKIERDAQELADSVGVKIFQADIIYHLFDSFTKYQIELKQTKREEFKDIAVFPCKVRILPQFIFNTRGPIVMGVVVENGILKEGTPLCVPSKEFLNCGIVTSVEINHKPIGYARRGQEVCLKISPTPGEAPKLYGRHFDYTDPLVSKISRESINACKEYFREDLMKADWQLMVELKNLFQIL